MATENASNQTKVIQEADLKSAPMSAEHKDLVIRHLCRLTKILEANDDNAIARYTSKKMARQQLACMTLVFGDCMSKYKNGDFEDDEIESMAADMVDASFYFDAETHSYSQPAIACTNPALFGREQEMEALIQQLQAESIDDVSELWNVPQTDGALEYDGVNDLGKDLDWQEHLREYASDDEPINTLGKDVDVEGRLEKLRALKKATYKDLDRTWPPGSKKKKFKCIRRMMKRWDLNATT